MYRGNYTSAWTHACELIYDGEVDEAYDELLRIAEEYRDVLYYHNNEVYRILGDISLVRGDEKLCLQYWKQEKKMDQREQMDRAAYLLYENESLEESERWCRKYLEYVMRRPRKGDKEGVADILLRLGNVYLERDDLVRAFGFFDAADIFGASVKRVMRELRSEGITEAEFDEVVPRLMERLGVRRLTGSEKIDELVAKSNKAQKIVYNPRKNKHEYVPPPPLSEAYAAAVERALPKLEELPGYDRGKEWHLDGYYQRKIIEKHWTEGLTEVLRVTVREWKGEALWHVKEALLSRMSEDERSRFYSDFDRYDIPWNSNTLMHYAVDKAEKLGFGYDPPGVKNCVHCGERFSEEDITGSLAMRVEHPKVPSVYCPNCLSSALWGTRKVRRSREEMIEDLRRIVGKIGFVPSGVLLKPNTYGEKNKLPMDTLRIIIGDLADAATYEMYKLEFGSWSEVLIIAGLNKRD